MKILSDNDFKGYTTAKLEDLILRVDNMRISFENHIIDEREKSEDFRKKLEELVNWKWKVTGMASIGGAVVGFLVNKFIK